MQKLKNLAKNMEEELQDAKKYIDDAFHCRAENRPEAADIYLKMAEGELTHASYFDEMISAYVKRHIEEKEKIILKTIFDYVHEKYVEESSHIRTLLDVAKRV